MRAPLVGVITLGSAVSALPGHPLPMDIESLIAVPGVLVIVEGVTRDAALDGLAGDSLRAAMEDRLHEAGIPVLTEAQWREVIGNPTLQLSLQLLKPSPHLYIYSGTLELRQLTVLARDSTKAAYTRTWSAGNLLGTVPTARLPALRDDVLELVEQFVETYQRVNRGAPPGRAAPVRSGTLSPTLGEVARQDVR